MELSTISMDPAAAKAAYDEYAEAVKERHDAEDAAIAQGYKALADGKLLLNLADTIRAGGTTEVRARRRWDRTLVDVTVPRLAAIRAGAKVAYTTGVQPDGSCQITADKRAHELHFANRRDRFRLEAGTFGEVDHYGISLKAIVPNIPPRLRPKRGLHLYTILWEAIWAAEPAPPHDPALLRHLGGDLYVVLGVWDLTDLERTVLAGRI